MKIESVEAFPMRIKTKEKLRTGTFAYPGFQTVLVKAICDGEAGWGEAMTRFDPGATAATVRYLAKSVVGARFVSPSAAWSKVWRELRVRGHTRGLGVEALSGIEIALYDCYARLRKKSVGALLAGDASDEVGVFAGSLFDSRGALRSQVDVAKESGMQGAKVKVGFGIDRDLELLTAVRDAWPEGMLVADANGAYDATTATRACRAFRGLDLSWFEEPVLSDDWDGYAMLKGKGVRIGAGESWFVSDFDGPIDERLVGVLEPSVSRCGGVGVEADVARRAASAGIDFAPMTGMNSAISLAASVQVASAYPSLGVEYNPFPNPLQSELAPGFPEPRDGRLRVPGGPGLGLEIDQRFVKAHIV